jgi:hypothetical protein
MHNRKPLRFQQYRTTSLGYCGKPAIAKLAFLYLSHVGYQILQSTSHAATLAISYPFFGGYLSPDMKISISVGVERHLRLLKTNYNFTLSAMNFPEIPSVRCIIQKEEDNFTGTYRHTSFIIAIPNSLPFGSSKLVQAESSEGCGVVAVTGRGEIRVRCWSFEASSSLVHGPTEGSA